MTAFADIYRWVDKDGRVHYSDKPAQDIESKHIEIEPTPTPEKPQRDKLQRRSLGEAVKEGEIDHLTDPKDFAALGVFFTPAVLVDEEVIESGHVPSIDRLKTLLNERG